MPETLEPKQARVLRVGPDRVTVTDHEVVIEARHEIPEWRVQKVHTPAIYFEDKKYWLAELGQATRPFSVRYVLRPWPAGKVANPKLFFTYDTEAVNERDGNRRGEAASEIIWVMLLPFYPFLGLLWSGMQQRLHRFGYLPRTITGLSIFTGFGLMLTQGAFIALLLQASARSGTMMIGGMIRALWGENYVHLGPVSLPVALFDFCLALALLADVAIRYSHYLRDDQWAGGFLEWLLPQSLRRKRPGE